MAQRFEDALERHQQPFPSACIGVLVRDAVQHRLLQGVASQLDLQVEDISEASIDFDDFTGYEVVVADREEAERLHHRLTTIASEADSVHPVVVALASAGQPGDLLPDVRSTQDIILLPQEPAQLLVQFSVVLYAHRAFAQQYQSAIDELHLNRRIFRSVTSGISVADATVNDLPLTYVNPAFEVMTGYSLESIQGKNCRFLQGEEGDQPALTLLRDAIAEQRQVTVVLRNYRKDGSCFWNELSMAPIRNRAGKLTHFVGIQNDVSARMEFEAALRESEKLAAVGRLAASIAHEINNPLESVMNLLYLAQSETTLSGVRNYVSEAESEVRRIALITTQSLRFYRQNTKAQHMDCDTLLTEVLELYSPKLIRFGIETRHDRTSHDPVFCMDSEIRQVLSNLVRNAIDAMRPGGGRLIARTRVMTEHRTGQRGVAITIADTGSGIPPGIMKKLYTAFFTTKGDVGTGLGLWVSANIIDRHSGRLLVRSAPGKGTVFTMFLPFESKIVTYR